MRLTRTFTASSPEQVRNARIEDVLAVIADIDQELRPVEKRLEQRRRTADEHTDWRVVKAQRRQLQELRRMVKVLSPYCYKD